MADSEIGPTQGTTERGATPVANSRFDPVTLAAGVLALAVAGYVAFDLDWDLQWFLAVGAVLVGIGMLVTSLKPRPRR